MKKRAILLAGGINSIANHNRYGNDLGFAYQVLVEKCGYAEDEISVFYCYGKPISFKSWSIATDIADKGKVIRQLQQYIQELEENDELLFIVSNHGSDDKEGAINLWGIEILYLSELADMLKSSNANKLILLGQCYSGNFLSNTIPNACIITGNEPGKMTYVHPGNWEYDELFYNFFSFLNGKYPDKDENIQEGNVNIGKAFQFAVEHDALNPNLSCYYGGYNRAGETHTEIPQMFNNISELERMLQGCQGRGVGC